MWTMRHPDDAESMVDRIEADGLKRAVLIGAGYIGVEMAEALRRRGLDVTIVEMFDQIMPQFLDSEIVCSQPGTCGKKASNWRLASRCWQSREMEKLHRFELIKGIFPRTSL